MTAIATVDLNAGPDGTAVTAGNSGVTSVSTGFPPHYESTAAIEGAFSAICNGAAGTSFFRQEFAGNQADAFASMYFVMPTIGTTFTLMTLSDTLGANVGASVRIMNDGTLQLRDGTVSRGATGIVTAGTVCRVELKSTPTSASSTACELNLFVGGNRNAAVGSTPDGHVAGVNTSTAVGSGLLRCVTFGAITSGVDVMIDRIHVDDTVYPAPMTSTAPTVTAGPDLTKDTSSANFTITAVATPASPATISSRAWTHSPANTGPTVTLANQTTDTVTITPSGTTGTTTLRYTATDSNGSSAFDDVAITWVTPGRVLHPASDVGSLNGWAATPAAGNTATNIDELVMDTADYVASPDQATAAEKKWRLDAGAAPSSTTGNIMEVGADITATVATHAFVVKMYDSDGTTLRKTFTTVTDLTTTPTIRQFTLSSGEAGSLVGWTAGLVFSVTATTTV